MDTSDQLILEPVHSDKIRVFTLALFIIIALIIAFYTLIFTPWGNRQIAPIVQKQIASLLQQPITLTTFSLTLNHFEITLTDQTKNIARLQGNYLLLPPQINAHYDANLSALQGINLVGFPLDINGSLIGSYYHLTLQGTAKLFHGTLDYHTLFRFAALSSAKLTLHNIHYQELMDALEYPHNSDTVLNGHLYISGIERRDINATGSLTATTHHFKPSPIMEDDNESFDFWSLLADKEGKIPPFKINTSLNAAVDELGILEQFASYPLRTAASINATLQGSEHQLRLDTTAQAARGDTHAVLMLHRLRPSHLHLNIKHARAESLFRLLSLPAPITGTINAQADTNFTNASIALKLNNGHTNPTILKQHYGLTQPYLAFDSSVKLILSPNERHYSGTFTSDLKNIPFTASPTHDQMLQELLRQLQQNRPKGQI